MNYVNYTCENEIGVLTIDRQSALNALNGEVVKELVEVLDKIALEPIRALIITGAGEKSFVAGADISEMWSLNKKEALKLSKDGNEVMRKVEVLPMPVIAAINGYALGGGCELALSCDIRIASKNALFGFPEVSLGVIPGYGGIQRINRLIGTGLAKKMVFTGMRIKADEALNLGVVDQVCELDDLMNEAKKLANQIGKNAPIAVRQAKKVMNESVGLKLSDSDCLEAEAFANCFETEDQYNGMGMFLKKVEPTEFKGK
ncbi:MAG: enoyl-CoA hydratase-related protein [Lachnospirales bacterium]